MKKYFLLTLFIACVCLTVNGQSSSKENHYTNAMVATIKMFDTVSTAASLTQSANAFERIANVEKSKWEPYYYAAYCYALMAVKTKDADKIDVIADYSESLLQKAEAIAANNSEITCLFAMIHSARIMADPVARFQSYSKEVHALLAKAKSQNQNNPRIYFLEAKFLLKTPEMLGGGSKIAKEPANIAVSKFEIFVPESAIAPQWGSIQAKELANKLAGN